MFILKCMCIVRYLGIGFVDCMGIFLVFEVYVFDVLECFSLDIRIDEEDI